MNDSFFSYNFENYLKNFSLSIVFSVGVEECFTKIVKFYLEGCPTVRISGGYSQEMMGLFQGKFFNHFLSTRKINILNNVTVGIAGMYIILKKQIY